MSDNKLARKVKKLINKPDEFFKDSGNPALQQLGNLWKWRAARQGSASAALAALELKPAGAAAAAPKPEPVSKASPLLKRAAKEQVAGNLQRALELYSEATTLAPEDNDAVAGEAACRFLLGHYALASELFDGLVAARPASVDYVRAAELSRLMLAEPQSSPALRPSSLLAVLESSTHKAAKGWISSDGSRRKVSVALSVDGQPAGSQVVELKRRQPAKGLTFVDFTFALSRDVCDGAEHELVVSLEGRANHVFGNPQRRILGELKVGEFSVSYGYVRGTVWPQAFLKKGQEHQPQQTTVNVLLDGVSIRTLVVKFVGENGAPQPAMFSAKLPMPVSDGKPHELRVEVPDLGTDLPTADGLATFVLQEELCGQVEDIKHCELTGWVFDVGRPEEPLEVSLFDGDVLLESRLTDVVRADVNRAFRLQGSHGFSFQLPVEMCDGRGHYLRVYVGSHRLPSGFDDQPVVVDRAALAAAPRRFQGAVEALTSERVAGWAADLAAPNRPVHVTVRVDGVAVVTVLANQFSARIKNAGKGSGHHWFYIPLPTRLMNGKACEVDVSIVESGGKVVIGKGSVKFPLVDYFGNLPRLPSFERKETEAQNGSHATPLTFDAVKPVISLIVLNLDGDFLLPGLFASLAQVAWNVPIEVIFIDHGSTDQSLAIAYEAEKYLPMRVIARNANYSFSESNNYGAGLARGEYLAFVNNDIVFQNDCLTPLCAHFADPSVGLAGLRLVEPLLGPEGEMKLTTHHVAVKLAPSLVAEKTHGRMYMPLEIDNDEGAAPACREVPAVTAALIVCRKSDFLALHGFDEGYFYGLEDIDLSHKFQYELGKRVICDTRVSAIHLRSATRNRAKRKLESATVTVAPVSAMQNRERYVMRFGRKFTRDILLSLVRGQSFWRREPLQVTFAVTEADINTGAGDFFTALELGEALREEFGYKIMFVTMDSFELPGTDVLIVMRHDYDVKKIINANPGLINVAWIRNRVDEWLKVGQLEAYHTVFCSSQRGADEIFQHTGRVTPLLPIATNPKRFKPVPPKKHLAADVTFNGHYWKSNRDGLEMIDPDRIDGTLAIYGQNWDKRPEWHPYWRGQLPYVDMPEVYASTSVVIDDSHPVTRRWGSLNSRVFDALGAGKLVLTNCREGAQALFGDRLPTYESAEELEGLINHYLHEPAEREALASSLREEVLAAHTYNHRARTVKSGLENLLTRGFRFGIKVPIPKAQNKEHWGDYHFALGIKRALEARGHSARIDLLPDWKGGLGISDDVVLVLRGLSQYVPTPRSLNLMWLISHPTEVAHAEYEKYDHLFVASQSFAQELGGKLSVPVSPLLQCTDPALFSPRPAPEGVDVPGVLFVGNSRNQKRRIIRDCMEANIDVGVYGSMWERLIPERLWRGQHISNGDLASYYSNAKVVLNDHWPDMSRNGFISNRIFDAGACGASIVTDPVVGLDDLFGGLVHSYEGASQLSPLVERLTADDAGRAERGAKLGDLIRREHTFGHRIDAMLRVVERMLGHTSAAVENGSSTRSVGTAAAPREQHAAPAIGLP